MKPTRIQSCKELQGISGISWQKFFVAVFFVAILFATSSLQAVPITVPTDLNPGDTYRLAFVTSTTRDATSSNIADYNSFVAAVAAGEPALAALGTTWTAIGSTSTVDARDNTGTNPSSTGVPIYRLDDTRIADDNTDLWDGLLAAPLQTVPTGVLVLAQVSVWTGTDTAGLRSVPLGGALVRRGRSVSSVNDWIQASTPGAANLFRLYAMSGVLTVIPEPSTMILVCIGATAVAGWQLRRRRHRRRQ